MNARVVIYDNSVDSIKGCIAKTCIWRVAGIPLSLVFIPLHYHSIQACSLYKTTGPTFESALSPQSSLKAVGRAC